MAKRFICSPSRMEPINIKTAILKIAGKKDVCISDHDLKLCLHLYLSSLKLSTKNIGQLCITKNIHDVFVVD